MSTEIFLLAYIILVIIMITIEFLILFHDKNRYIRHACKGLIKVLEYKKSEYEIAEEIDAFYNRYVQERVDIKNKFPNVIVWIDAIIFRVEFDFKYARCLKRHYELIKKARNILQKSYPYNKCEKYQQSLLTDIDNLCIDNGRNNVDNVVNRTAEEFVRLNNDIKKNMRLNTVSIMIGIIGIVVSVLMAIM